MSDWWSADPVAADGPPLQITPRVPNPALAHPSARDLAIRTIYGEAATEPEQGQAGVAAVIRNRLESGRYGNTIPQVVLAKNQFEPWSRPDARARMTALKPGDPDYERIGGIVDRVFSGDMEDPTGGATHFFSPNAQAALGRRPPSWAQGQPLTIGGHAFYAPEGRATDVSAQRRQSEPAGEWWASDPVSSEGDNFSDRFGGMAPAGDKGLKPALEERAAAMTRGPVTTPGQAMAIDFGNVLSSAQQGTTAQIPAHQKNLISTDVFQGDTGEILFRDPQTGQVVPTDQSKHVALRDPADNRVKIYARAPETEAGPVESVSKVLSSGMLAGAPTARPGLPAAINKAGDLVRGAEPRASEIMATAKPFYKAFEQEARAVPIAPQVAASYGTRIRDALDNANLNDELAKPVFSALARFDRGEPMGLDELQKVKRVVGRSFSSPDKNVRDGAAVATREINKIIAEASPEASQALRTADDIHSTALSVQELQRKGAVADLRAGRAGYGGNAVNSMRQVLSPIVQKAVEGRVTGFKPNEIAAMREIVEGTTATNLARGIGQLSPSKGIIQTVGAAGGVVAAGPGALAIPAIGAASNKIATVLTGVQIDRLKTLVAKRSPAYAEAVRKAVDRFERSQAEFVTQPSSKTFASYLTASRALSSGLARDGIPVTSGQLMKSLQRPVSADEEDQQQN